MENPRAVVTEMMVVNPFKGRGGGGEPPDPEGGPNLAERLLGEMHDKYASRCKAFRWMYYGTRLVSGLSAIAVAPLIAYAPTLAAIFSTLTAVCVVIDTVFDPKTKWGVYSKATDMLMMAELKRTGQYDKYKSALDILVKTEDQALGKLGVQEVIDRAEGGSSSERPKKLR